MLATIPFQSSKKAVKLVLDETTQKTLRADPLTVDNIKRTLGKKVQGLVQNAEMDNEYYSICLKKCLDESENWNDRQ